MNRYEIKCTEEQTKKALELGAPIEMLPNYNEYRMFPFVKCTDGNERPCILPTSEQMINWLEEQDNIVSIEIFEFEGYWSFYVITVKPNDSIYGKDYETRKEATIAAIDAALDYLSNNKK